MTVLLLSERDFPGLGCSVTRVRNRLQDETLYAFMLFAAILNRRNFGKINTQVKF